MRQPSTGAFTRRALRYRRRVPIESRSTANAPAHEGDEAYDRLRRRVLWSMPTGLYLIGSLAGQERNMMTASLVIQVCVDPKLVGAAIESTSRSHDLIERGKVFTLTMVERSERAIIRKFVKPATDDREARTLNGYEYIDAPVTGAPILTAAIAYLDCRLEHGLPLGSHTLFVGEVVDAAFGPTETKDDRKVLRVEDTRMSYGG
jgi:flavin reductase (DIM6/NTAB) family NADH-FMN oxidoreductase RutF